MISVSKNKIIFFAFIVGITGLILNALLTELRRNTSLLENSISGLILSKPEISYGIIKTDNAHILLFDSLTLELVASKTINPFLPPLSFSIGQNDTKIPLSGSYRLLVLTDKNRNLNIPFFGEVIGPLSQPFSLGTEGIKYYLDKPFKELPSELMVSKKLFSESSISGTVYVSPLLSDKVDLSDRLVIMLFDKNQGRPVAFNIISNFKVPQKFSIGQINAMEGQVLNGKYSLRILTDKNNKPFQSSIGELIGRSKELIPLGTENLKFELDEEYRR